VEDTARLGGAPCTCRLRGFTDEELDFIINYDMKYRMGGAEGED